MTDEERALAKQMTLAWWERRNVGDEDRFYDDRDARSFYCAGIVDGRESTRGMGYEVMNQLLQAERARSAKLFGALKITYEKLNWAGVRYPPTEKAIAEYEAGK